MPITGKLKLVFRHSRKQRIWRDWFNKNPDPAPLDGYIILQNKKSKTIKVMAENVGKFGFDEVVDTLGDLIHAVGPNGIPQGIPKKGEKFDFVKFILAAVSEYPNIQEAVEDAATFWAQLKDLFPSESKAVSAALRAKYPTPSKLQESMLYNIENLALTQDYLQNNIWADGSVLLDRWKNQ